MAINYINTGSSPNKGDGDTLRTAFNKINDNFGQLSVALGLNATADFVASMFTGNTGVNGVKATYNTQTSAITLTLTTASSTRVGGIKVGTGLAITADGTLNVTSSIAATTSTIGGIIVGDNLTIDGNGRLSGVNSYVLPPATDTTLGGVKVGAGLSVSNTGTITASAQSDQALFTTSSVRFQSVTLAGTGGDPYWDNVTVLLHGNDFIDYSPHPQVVSQTGVTISTSTYKFGSASYTFDSTDRLSEPTIVADFDRHPFTVEGQFYFTQNNVGYQPLMANAGPADQEGWLLFINTNNTLALFASRVDGTWNYQFTTTYTPPIGQWIHIAVDRTVDLILGDVVTLYVNGSPVASGNCTEWMSPTDAFYLGYYANFPGGARSFQGNIDEVRITIGHARYQGASFSAPTQPYPNFPYSPNLGQIVFGDGTIQTTAAGAANPFDQDLNTTNSVSFSSVGATYGFIAQINGTNPGNELVIQAGGAYNWTFKSVGLEFPDSSIQTTAYRYTAGTVAPILTAGALWFNTTDGRLYVNYNNTWVDASPTVIDPSAIRYNTQNQIELPVGGDIVDSNGNSVLANLSSVGQHILPAANSVYDLGSTSSQWRSLYVSTNTIYINNVPLTIDTATNTLLVAGSQVTGSATTSTLFNNGYSFSIDETGIVNLPTFVGSPSIAIIQTDSNGISLNANEKFFIFQSDGSLTLPNGAGFGLGDNFQLKVNDGVTQSLDFRDTSGRGFYTNNDGYTLRSNGTYNWIFGTNGKLTFPDGTTQSGMNTTLPTANGSPNSVSWTFNDVGIGSDTIRLEWNLLTTRQSDWWLGVNDATGHDDYFHFSSANQSIGYAPLAQEGNGLLVFGTSTHGGAGGVNDIELASISGDVYVRTNTNYWKFGTAGGLTFPDATVQTTAWNDQAFTAAMSTYDGPIVTNTATVGVGGLTVNGPVVFNGPFTYLSTATTSVVGNTGTFYGDVYGVGALYAGVAGYSPLPATVFQSSANVNDYIQNNFQNLNNGVTASTEWVATANNGNDTNHYIDMGIAGSAWDGTQANSIGTAAQANDSWVYAQGSTSTSAGGNLILGTIKNGKSVKILAGSTGSSSIIATFNSTGLTLNAGALTFKDGSVQSTAGVTSSTVNTLIANSLTNYATQSYVTSRGYTTTASVNTLIANSLTSYATQSFVTGQGYITSSALNGYTTTASVNTLIVNSLTNYLSKTGGAVNSTSATPLTITSTGRPGSEYNTWTFFSNQGVGGPRAYIQFPDGTLQSTAYTGIISTATDSVVGGVKVGSNLTITADGTLSATAFNTSTLVAQAVTAQSVVGGIGVSSITAGTGTVVSTSTGAVTIWTTPTAWSGGTVNGTATVAVFIGTASATSTSTGAVVVQGGLGVGGNVYANTLYSNDGYFRGPAGYGTIQLASGGNVYITGSLILNSSGILAGPAGYPVIAVGTPSGAGNNGVKFYGTATVAGTTAATSTNTGALQVAGGAGIAGNTYVGGYVVQQALPAFRVYGANSTTYGIGTVLTATTFIVDYNQGNYLTTSTGIFTAPVAGLYQINIVGRAYSNAGVASQLAVVKNPSGTSSVMCMIEWAANTTVNHMGASTVAKLAVGDTLVAKVLLGSAQFDANDNWSVAFLG